MLASATEGDEFVAFDGGEDEVVGWVAGGAEGAFKVEVAAG